MSQTQPRQRERARQLDPERGVAQRPVLVAPPAQDDVQLEQHIFYWLTEIIGRRNRLLAPALKEFGLRVPEWRVLMSLKSRHKASFKELAELASFDQTTLSRTIDRMVKVGLVTRLSDVDDMRITRLALTAKGEALWHDLWPTVNELNAAACARLPEGGASMLRWLLGQMRVSLDDMIDKRKPPRNLRRGDAE
jgi:DNA-binding MarR family transcriptional regulator